MARGDALSDPALSELVRLKNFKQALKNVEKKLKKQPNSIELQILKADFILKSGDVEVARQLTEKLVTQKPIVTVGEDVGRLYAISNALALQGKPLTGSQLDNLWLNAIKVRSSQQEKASLAERWVEDAVGCGNWAHVAKAAGVLSKVDLGSAQDAQKYYMWQIVAQWLTQPPAEVTDERLRGLSKQMAIRMLDKTLEQTTKGSTPDKGIGITDHSQFDLLRLLYEQSGKQDQLLQSILDKGLISYGSLAADEWGINRSRVEVLEQQGKKAEAFDLARQIISDAQSRNVNWRLDDWRCYDHLARNVNEELLPDMKKFIKNIVNRNPKARSPHAGLLQVQCNETAEHGSEDQTPLVEMALDTFKKFGGQVESFNDMRSVLDQLNPASRDKLVKQIYEHTQVGADGVSINELSLERINQQANALTLDFHVTTASKNQPSTAHLYNLTARCVALYQKCLNAAITLASTDTHPGDPALILATRILAHLSSQENTKTPILLACTLLTLIAQKPNSTHNFTARLMLINMLMHLGCPTLALQHHAQLGVKEVLIESCSPIIFARIYTLMPFPSKDIDPQEVMAKCAKFYANALARIPRYQVAAMDANNYVPAIEFEGVKDKMRGSDTRRLLVAERRCIARVRGVGCEEGDLGLEEWPLRRIGELLVAEAAAAKDGQGKKGDLQGRAWMKTMADKILVHDPPPMTRPYVDVLEIIHSVLDLTTPVEVTPNPDFVERVLATVRNTQPKVLSDMEMRTLEIATTISRLRYATITAILDTADVASLVETLGYRVSHFVLPSSDRIMTYHLPHTLTLTHSLLRAIHGASAAAVAAVKKLKGDELTARLTRLQQACAARWKEFESQARDMAMKAGDGDALYRTAFRWIEPESKELRETILMCFGDAQVKAVVGALAKDQEECVARLVSGLKDL